MSGPVSVGNGVFKIEIQGADRLKFALNQGFSSAVRKALRAKVDQLAVEIQRTVKIDFLSGAPPGSLNVRTGTLRRSINIKRTDTATEVSASVGTNVIYGAAWELGHVRNWQGLQQPARPFLEPAYQHLRQKIQTELSKAVGDAVRKGAVLGS